ncbi:MAG: phosphomannomutase/phosphoglucomutase [Kiritimatiellia bacterium]
MAGIFKAYDIRGIYGEDLTEAIAYDIGLAFADRFKPQTVAVGRDMRPHSQPLFEAMAAGLTRQGVIVYDLGLCSTPMTYFGTGHLQTDAGIMITASHNTGEWNGCKLCLRNAVPVSGATGIKDIETAVTQKQFAPAAVTQGEIRNYPIQEKYAAHIRPEAALARPVRIAADMANGMGIIESIVLRDLLEIDPLFDDLDGSFPNHEANPLKSETYAALQAHVQAGTYDFGVAFDGDADRVGFTDEKGNIIPMDLITALIAQDLLQQQKGTILYDLRSSRAVKEIIAENGGTPIMCRVGHSFIKQQMRETDAIFAGELSGHYYFRFEDVFAESAALAVLRIANIVSASDKPLSEIIRPIQRYVASGEINSEVEDTQAVLQKLKMRYADAEQFELDGLSVNYPDWWFNVRCSNTEPLIRLNTEASNRTDMQKHRDELLAIIRG